MSMEVKGNNNYYSANLAGKTQEEIQPDKTVEDKRIKENKGKEENGKIPVPEDKYIRSEDDVKASGLYYLGKDKNGSPKIFFNKWEKTDNAKYPDSREEAGAAPEIAKKKEKTEDKEEILTGNTNKPDQEIKKLKNKKKQLKQKISQASGDEKKLKELKQQLAQVESQLVLKDNDTYRKDQSSFSSTINRKDSPAS